MKIPQVSKVFGEALGEPYTFLAHDNDNNFFLEIEESSVFTYLGLKIQFSKENIIFSSVA